MFGWINQSGGDDILPRQTKQQTFGKTSYETSDLLKNGVCFVRCTIKIDNLGVSGGESHLTGHHVEHDAYLASDPTRTLDIKADKKSDESICRQEVTVMAAGEENQNEFLKNGTEK